MEPIGTNVSAVDEAKMTASSQKQRQNPQAFEPGPLPDMTSPRYYKIN